MSSFRISIAELDDTGNPLQVGVLISGMFS